MASGNIIRGNRNTVFSNNSTIQGDGNQVSGQTVNLVNAFNVTVSGDNITAIGVSGGTLMQNDTTYIQSLTVLSSITINNTVYTGNTLAGPWTASTGLGSIVPIDSPNNIASGNYSIAIGTGNTVNGRGDFVGGFNNVISASTTNNQATIIFGRDNVISASTSAIFGRGNIISGSLASASCFISGQNNRITSGVIGATVLGSSNIASGLYSIATGSNTRATADASVAGGVYAVAERLTEWTRSSPVLYNSTTQAPQYGKFSMGVVTNGAGSTQMFIDNQGLNSVFLINNNSAFYVQIKCIATIATGVTAGQTVVFDAQGIVKKSRGTIVTETPFNTGTGNLFPNYWTSGSSLSGTILSVNPGGASDLEFAAFGITATQINWFCEVSYQKVTW